VEIVAASMGRTRLPLFELRQRDLGANCGSGSAPPEETKGAIMQLPDDVIDDVRKRLHRVAGQVQGVERMLDEGRECRDVITQLSAATKALEQAGLRLVASGLTYCLEHPDQAKADGYAIDSVQRMLMKLT
jgi:DNA-binding FrmR family transcriptional regulator